MNNHPLFGWLFIFRLNAPCTPTPFSFRILHKVRNDHLAGYYSQAYVHNPSILSVKVQMSIIGRRERNIGIANMAIKPIEIYKIVLLKAFCSSFSYISSFFRLQ